MLGAVTTEARPCAAALATLAVIDREGLITNPVAIGRHLAAGAKALGPAVRIPPRGFTRPEADILLGALKEVLA